MLVDDDEFQRDADNDKDFFDDIDIDNDNGAVDGDNSDDRDDRR